MILQSLRLARRSLSKHLGFSLGVIALIGLGVAAVTSVYSVVDGVLLRALPYPEEDRLVYFADGSHPIPLVEQWSDSPELDGLASAWVENFALVGGERPRQVRTAQLSPGFFELFGARPQAGRLLIEDDWRDDQRSVVLSDELWRNVFSADREIVGDTVNLAGEPYVVVGVLAREFVPPEALVGREVEAWVPLPPGHRFAEERNVYVLQVAGRLRGGSSIEQAQTWLDALHERNASDFPDTDRSPAGEPRTVPIQPLHEATTSGAAGTLQLVLGAVGLLLLIAVANVACLFLARGTQREREVAILAALGAGRRRVATQMLTESTILSVLGGLLGFAMAHGAIAAFRSLAPVDLPRLDAVTVDLRAFGFAFVVSLVAGLLCGVAPALSATRTDAAQAFREAGASVGAPKQRLRSTLVVAEVAMAVVLLSGAGLLFHSVLELMAVEPGFETEHLVRIALERGGIDAGDGSDSADDESDFEQIAFVDRLLDELRAVPGVEQAAAGWTMPFDFTGGGRCCWRSGFRTTPSEDAEPVRSLVHPMTPEVFEVLGVSLREGRMFDARDSSADADNAPVVVNRTMARELYPDDDGARALGSTLYLRDSTMQIVGVVDDIRHYGLDADDEAAVYVPYSVFGGGVPLISVLLKTRLPADELAPTLRRAVWSIDPDLPVLEIESMQRRVAQSIREPKFYSVLFATFAGVALLLAAGGVYAALLFVVGTRRREVGIRMALGAVRAQILRMMIARGMLLVGIGAVLGLGVSLLVTKYLESLLFGIGTREPLALAGGIALLALVGLVASYLPARRSARLEPMETLRAE